jgi:hypothetical protein
MRQFVLERHALPYITNNSSKPWSQMKPPGPISRADYLAGMLAVAFAVFYFVAQSWGQDLLAVSTDLLFILVSGACSLLGFVVVRRWGFKGKFGVIRFGLFLAVFLWFLGESAWGVYEIVLHANVPYPSVADVFYLGGYIPALLGLVQFLWFFRETFTPRKLALAALSGLAIAFVSGAILLYPLMNESADTLTKLFDVGYPLLDAFLVALAVMVTITFERGRFANDWLWIALGMILNAVADMAFSYGTLAGWYYSGHPIELLYVWSYLCLGLGFAHQTRKLPSA